MAGNLSFDELKKAVKSGAIDTVVVAMVDMQGRLIGKRRFSLKRSPGY
jgi:glutamine synthetase